MRRVLRNLFAYSLLLLIASCCLLFTPAFAAPSPNPPTSEIAPDPSLPKSSGLDASSIPSEKINQFVQAYLQVVAVIDRREGELQGAETESESLRIERDIEAEAIACIEKSGLSRQEYLQLLSLSNVDSEFGERVATLLQEAAS